MKDFFNGIFCFLVCGTCALLVYGYLIEPHLTELKRIASYTVYGLDILFVSACGIVGGVQTGLERKDCGLLMLSWMTDAALVLAAVWIWGTKWIPFLSPDAPSMLFGNAVIDRAMYEQDAIIFTFGILFGVFLFVLIRFLTIVLIMGPIALPIWGVRAMIGGFRKA